MWMHLCRRLRRFQSDFMADFTGIHWIKSAITLNGTERKNALTMIFIYGKHIFVWQMVTKAEWTVAISWHPTLNKSKSTPPLNGHKWYFCLDSKKWRKNNNNNNTEPLKVEEFARAKFKSFAKQQKTANSNAVRRESWWCEHFKRTKSVNQCGLNSNIE